MNRGAAAIVGYALITALCLFLVQGVPLVPEVAAALLVIAGMCTMGGLTAIAGTLSYRRPVPPTAALNVEFLVHAVEEARLPEEYTIGRPVDDIDVIAEDIPEVQTIADSALRLAAMRIALEKELRRIAVEAGVSGSRRLVSVRSIARELVASGILPEVLVQPIEVAVEQANRAIHGQPVADEDAESALAIGTHLVTRLRTLAPGLAFEEAVVTAISQGKAPFAVDRVHHGPSFEKPLERRPDIIAEAPDAVYVIELKATPFAERLDAAARQVELYADALRRSEASFLRGRDVVPLLIVPSSVKIPDDYESVLFYQFDLKERRFVTRTPYGQASQ